jgi:putative FmdB family regulatory protein
MPIYEFKCNDCKLILEETHTMANAPSETECPDCGKIVPRHYGSLNFALKGDGWPGKNIKNGISATADNKLEADQLDRKKKGQRVFDKEVPMSDEEFKRRKKLTERWIDETPKK